MTPPSDFPRSPDRVDPLDRLDRLDRLTRLTRLTVRERQVLALMALGRSNAGIARALAVTAKAVEKHVANIFVKLDLGRAEADDHRRVLAVLWWLGVAPAVASPTPPAHPEWARPAA